MAYNQFGMNPKTGRYSKEATKHHLSSSSKGYSEVKDRALKKRTDKVREAYEARHGKLMPHERLSRDARKATREVLMKK